MVRAEQKPGRRRAAPAPRRRRDESRAKAERPAGSPKRQRPAKVPTPSQPRDAERTDIPARPSAKPRTPGARTPLLRRLLVVLWVLAALAGLGAVVWPWTPAPVPGVLEDVLPLAGAAWLTTLFTFGLAVRTGGRPWLSGALALLLSAVAVLTGAPVLLAGAAVGTTVVAAVLGVMATTPAARFLHVVREVLLATAVAVTGAFAARAYGAEVSLERTGYLVIGISLLGALALVYRLGAGLHGLGRRGFVMILGGVVLLTVTLAYTEALAQWGSPGMIERVDGTFAAVRDVLGATPRPIEVLLGVPALAWGVSTRARRRQGWWVCAFGATGLAVVAVSLLGPEATLPTAGLTAAYSLVLGLLIGYAIIRADLFFTGARGRRARRLEELAAHRPEPGRMQPLL